MSNKNNVTQADIDNLANMELQLKKLLEENARLKEKASRQATEKALTIRVSAKGALSIYGLGRFPVTLYKSQMQRLLKFIASGAVEEFMIENDALLTDKVKAEDKEQTQAA